MPDKKDIPVEMERVHRRFERWRKTRRGRAPIPRRLWAAAASLAREHGVNLTSQALGLEFNKPRSFVESGKTRRKKVTAARRFSGTGGGARRGDRMRDRSGRPARQDAHRMEGSHSSRSGGSRPDALRLNSFAWTASRRR